MRRERGGEGEEEERMMSPWGHAASVLIALTTDDSRLWRGAVAPMTRLLFRERLDNELPQDYPNINSR